MTSIDYSELEWWYNWKVDERYYCTVLVIDASQYSKPKGFNKLLVDMFGEKYGGCRYESSMNGYECWFRRQEDIIAFKLLIPTRND